MGAAQHTKGWQTSVMGDAPESAPRGEAQGGLQPDSAKSATPQLDRILELEQRGR